MKKIVTSNQYRIRQIRIFKRNNRKLKSKRKKKPKEKSNLIVDIKPTVIAPSDLRLIENPEGCLAFFRELRSENNLSKNRMKKFVVMSLLEIRQIDYGAISILTAISDFLKFKNITLKGDFPKEMACKQFLIDSGFLSHMYDESGKPFPKSETSDLVFFEKGSGKLSLQDNIAISNTVKNVVKHLTGETHQCLSIKSIILEICGNSIEWGGTENKHWLLGVKYEKEKVIFTVTDVGRGILDSLHRKFSTALIDIFSFKSKAEILQGAFERKYGSSTKEVNRNKGLPAIKQNFDQETILGLIVLCNNVILHFDSENRTRIFEAGRPRFKGTFYQWEMTRDCLNNISINKNENFKYI